MRQCPHPHVMRLEWIDHRFRFVDSFRSALVCGTCAENIEEAEYNELVSSEPVSSEPA